MKTSNNVKERMLEAFETILFEIEMSNREILWFEALVDGITRTPSSKNLAISTIHYKGGNELTGQYDHAEHCSVEFILTSMLFST